MELLNKAIIDYLKHLPDGSSKVVSQQSNLVSTNLAPLYPPKVILTGTNYIPAMPPQRRQNPPYIWLLFWLLFGRSLQWGIF